jgi:hypothetical protein
MRRLISTAIITLSLLLSPPNLYSCTCGPPTPEKAFEKAGAIFIGEFTGFTKALFNRRQYPALRFEVEKYWKGDLPDEIVLPYGDMHRMCGELDFIKGERYLIYATYLHGELVVIVDCGRSRRIIYAGEDLEYLNKHAQDKKP